MKESLVFGKLIVVAVNSHAFAEHLEIPTNATNPLDVANKVFTRPVGLGRLHHADEGMVVIKGARFALPSKVVPCSI